MNEKEMLTDALATQKFTTTSYNIWAGECVKKDLRKTMLELLDEEHEIQNTVFQEMHTRGWYDTPKATLSEIDQAKTKLIGY